jgi:protein-L-isoaspartate(D-aspartate) O-methyltransferase
MGGEQALQGIGLTSPRTRERLVSRLRAAGIRNPDVLEAIRTVPRHLFVDEALAGRAYEESALPIGHGQTISQPYMVARMSELLLERGPVYALLEVGTGSGYQAAVLAHLVRRVYTVERVGALHENARERMRHLKLRNVRFRHADGAQGWPEYAPFDGILVTAAPASVPKGLTSQLAPGGQMVIPVGRRNDQMLVRITRTAQGYVHEDLEQVTFVPLLGGLG